MGLLLTIPINGFQGSQTSPAVNIPVGAQTVIVDFDGAGLVNPAITIVTKIEYAPDANTWRTLAGCTFVGGGTSRPNGDALASYPMSTAIPTDGANRKLRGTLTVTGGALTTVGHLSTVP